MENTFLFNDIEEEEVTTETTLPEQTEPTLLFNDLEDEPTYVPPKTTLPSQEGGAFGFDDVETDEDFDMSIDPAVEEPIISTDQPNILSKEDVDTRIDNLFAAGRDKRETEKGTRATVITDEWNTYYERVAQAEKEDEITGGQRALMIPKPQSAQFGLANIKAYEEKQESNRDY